MFAKKLGKIGVYGLIVLEHADGVCWLCGPSETVIARLPRILLVSRTTEMPTPVDQSRHVDGTDARFAFVVVKQEGTTILTIEGATRGPHGLVAGCA